MPVPEEIALLLMEMQIPSQSKREHREAGNLYSTTTFLFVLSTTLFLILLGLLVNDGIKKFTMSEDFYYISHIPKISSGSSPSFSFFNSCDKGFTDRLAPKKVWHSMSDDELMWRASMSSNIVEYPYNRTPKVAFMFLVKDRLPLKPIWERLFKGHQHLLSIYVHCSLGCVEEPSPSSSAFYKRTIPSKLVEWGKATMIDAERRLLANALLDFSNQRFVLLSDSCIPLFNFTTIYNHLINSTQSFLGSFDDPRPIGRGRYNKRMWPVVNISEWRKGSQWFEVHRKLAVEIISDRKYYPVFQDHCRPPCYMDEHYLPTLVVMLKHAEVNSNRSLTWVDWSTGGSHPRTFMKRDISQDFLNGIRHGFNCSYNGVNTSLCFLFARKFHPNTLEPLLRITPTLLGFNV